MTHDQVRQLVRRVNPIPDLSVLEAVDAPVLGLERSKDMQVDERPTADERRGNRWRGPVIGIAVAAVILIAGLIYISTDREPVAEPAPNAVPLPSEDFESVEPGAYYSDTDGNEETSTRGTFVIESHPWEVWGSGVSRDTPAGVDNGLYVSLIVAEIDQVGAACGGGGSQPAGTTARALGEQFAALGFTTVEELSPVQAFGQEGYHLAIEVAAGCTEEVWVGPTFGREYQAEGQVVEFWFLDVDDTTVMVEATRPPESTEETAAELEADLDEVLDTLVITP